MLERLKSDNLRVNSSYIWYFFILSECKDIRTLPLLFRYELKEFNGFVIEFILHGKIHIKHFRGASAYAGRAFVGVVNDHKYIIVALVITSIMAVILLKVRIKFR